MKGSFKEQKKILHMNSRVNIKQTAMFTVWTTLATTQRHLLQTVSTCLLCHLILKHFYIYRKNHRKECFWHELSFETEQAEALAGSVVVFSFIHVPLVFVIAFWLCWNWQAIQRNAWLAAGFAQFEWKHLEAFQPAVCEELFYATLFIILWYCNKTDFCPKYKHCCDCSPNILGQRAAVNWGEFRANMWVDKDTYHFPVNPFICLCFPDQSSWGQMVHEHDLTWSWNDDQMYRSLWQSLNSTLNSLTSWQNGVVIDNFTIILSEKKKKKVEKAEKVSLWIQRFQCCLTLNFSQVTSNCHDDGGPVTSHTLSSRHTCVQSEQSTTRSDTYSSPDCLCGIRDFTLILSCLSAWFWPCLASALDSETLSIFW